MWLHSANSKSHYQCWFQHLLECMCACTSTFCCLQVRVHPRSGSGKCPSTPKGINLTQFKPTGRQDAPGTAQSSPVSQQRSRPSENQNPTNGSPGCCPLRSSGWTLGPVLVWCPPAGHFQQNLQNRVRTSEELRVGLAAPGM